MELLDGDTNQYSSMSVSLPGEELSFDSIDEFLAAKLQKPITDFKLHIRAGEKIIYLRSGDSLNYFSKISATAPSEAWCAGAIETTMSIVQNNRRWYSGLVRIPFGIILFGLLNLPIALSYMPSSLRLAPSMTSTVAWQAAIAALFLFWLFRHKLLPGAIIVSAPHESFFRKHSVEIGILIASISAILALIQIFVE